MCGIAGFTTFRTAPPDPDSTIRAMTAALTPRGPDGEGFYADPAVRLGHRRLSIIDIEGGAQPMAAEGGRYQIVFNGEIYNHVELREELQARGRVFATRSDTEVILHAYALDGERALQRFNGIFAFALWDRDERKLFLARDRIGVKPLYYAVCDGELLFASELKALVRHPRLPRRLDLPSVSKYFAYGYIPAPHTIYEGVHKLEPGCALSFGAAGAVRTCYWDIPLKDAPPSGRNADETAEALLGHLRAAVRLQLRADVPVGVFLSGGIDSSVVAALAAQAGVGRIQSFTIGFEESSYDESPYALAVARHCGTDHHHETLSSRTALETLPRALDILDEPFGDASILPTYLLSGFAARRVKCVLGGDGSDELFAGYPAFQAHRLVQRLSFLPVGWRDAMNRVARRLPISHQYASLEHLARQFFRGAGLSPEVRFLIWLGAYGNEERRQLLSEDARNRLVRENPFEDAAEYVRRCGLGNDFERLLYLCMKLYLQDGILVKLDRASMAHSLEARVPFLDHQLVEFVSDIPSDYKLRGFTTKYILKRAVKDLLPPGIIGRRKAGFMIPLAAWLGGDLRDMVEDLCRGETAQRDGLFNAAFIHRLLDEHFQRKRDHRKLIWTLLVFLWWRRSHDLET